MARGKRKRSAPVAGSRSWKRVKEAKKRSRLAKREHTREQQHASLLARGWTAVPYPRRENAMRWVPPTGVGSYPRTEAVRIQERADLLRSQHQEAMAHDAGAMA
jgi:hypothetical protein